MGNLVQAGERGALRSMPVAGALIMRGLAPLTGEVSARRLMSRRMPFWETPSPALPDGKGATSGGGSVIAPAVAPTDHSAGMTDGGSGHADTSYSGPEWAASEADLRDHTVRLRNWRWR